MSYLSPLPHYLQPRGRSRSWAHVLPAPLEEETWSDPRLHLHHPLHPERSYHIAGGHQRQFHDVTTIPSLRRPREPFKAWTLRHYSTQPLVFARPQTVNRFSSDRVYPMDDWTERISLCLDEIGRTTRSMNRWESIRPEQRFLLRPLVPTTLVRSATFVQTPIR